MIEFVKLRSDQPKGDYRLRLVFSNDAEGEFDFGTSITETSPMVEPPIVEPLSDPDFFARANVDCGALAWPNGFDLDPTQLHKEMQDTGALKTVSA